MKNIKLQRKYLYLKKNGDFRYYIQIHNIER